MTRDLFASVASPATLHPLFTVLRDASHHEAARRLMNLIFADFQDVDKSFIQELQTAGFSPRVFELALFAYLQEHGVDLDRAEVAPDFVMRGDHPVAIEVTTTNPPQGAPSAATTEFSWFPSDFEEADKAFVFQLGKALRRKLDHRDAQGRAYWEKPHVVGVPFVIAVGAFHNEHAQWHPMGQVAQYLYGQREAVTQDTDGSRVIRHETIEQHEFNGKTIPSGLFPPARGCTSLRCALQQRAYRGDVRSHWYGTRTGTTERGVVPYRILLRPCPGRCRGSAVWLRRWRPSAR